MLAHSNHGRMNSVFSRIQAYIRTLAPREEVGSPFTFRWCRKIERILSIYNLTGVTQENFQQKGISQEGNRTG